MSTSLSTSFPSATEVVDEGSVTESSESVLAASVDFVFAAGFVFVAGFAVAGVFVSAGGVSGLTAFLGLLVDSVVEPGVDSSVVVGADVAGRVTETGGLAGVARGEVADGEVGRVASVSTSFLTVDVVTAGLFSFFFAVFELGTVPLPEPFGLEAKAGVARQRTLTPQRSARIRGLRRMD